MKHDVIAFTMAVGESVGDPAAARWLHYGMTSNDVVDTAQALLIRDASADLERDPGDFRRRSSTCARMNFVTRRRSDARTAFMPSRSPSA